LQDQTKEALQYASSRDIEGNKLVIMIRASKQIRAVTGVVETDSPDNDQSGEIELAVQSTFSRRLNIVLSLFIYMMAAFGISSHYCTSGYNETLPFRYKQYGSESKPCVVVIPGLDGATSFFQV
jgi:hypothetical protein